ncbi:DNA polymerase epsilon subunit 3-like [Carcharodon carcharias]|uniref:DNA polymerase epsilon subunit 3-like n=1 Tax=Carcharodon carcharias TaxID=13397 RepID=UPI001B7E5BAF|nr:DNA polymerase epsilon subunit 3-like [Carcharodon carcharias]
MAERPEDLNMLNAVITRIIKEVLPDGVNVSKEAHSTISRAASILILDATSCANNFAMKSKRKMLSASAVLAAMEKVEFNHFITPLKDLLEGMRHFKRERKEASEQKKDKKPESEEHYKSREDENEEDTEEVKMVEDDAQKEIENEEVDVEN